ncbi:MAG: c-type cytochrome [Alphaproteobacteria bacterium]|nr:c-type cytochrome [Alphaproteobacteria bacterium]
MSRPALFVGAAWAQTHESPMIGELEGITFDLGREALAEEVAAWNIDIRPDGQGLPEGSGDVWTGEEVYIENCAMCHGDFGEGRARWPVLAGGWDTLEREDPVKTPGSYWPYLSTVWDYVHRAMPYGQAQTLTDDEVYAITAYILYLNNLVDDDFELSQDNFTEVRLPNEDGFFMDDRDEGEIPAFSEEPCMENCKDNVEITMRASVLDVTPEEEEAEVTEAAAETTEDAATEEAATEDAATEEAPAEEEATEMAAVDPALVEEGEGVFRKCRACHQVGEGAVNRTGPHLNGVLGRTIGGIDDFRYSSVFEEANAAGQVWGPENLGAYLADPRGAMPGTKMSFAGLRSEDEIAAMIAYLSTFEAQ